MFHFFKSKKSPAKKLLVLGTEFGSYQFQQVVETSSDYTLVGFISDDSWQRKSSQKNIRVFTSMEIASIFEQESILAIVLPSDQKEFWLGAERDQETDEQGITNTSAQALEAWRDKVKICDVLSIPLTANKSESNQFLDQFMSS